jgi:glycosyltransferase involved in cell wall biosynthesis
MQSDISIVIPVFNRPESILKVFESIDKHSISNLLEVIVIDDSSDETSAIIKNYKNKTNSLNIVHIQPARRAGVSGSRNIGIKKAKGDIIVFVDSDDLLLKGSLQRIVKAFQRENELVLYFGLSLYKSGKTKNFLDKNFLEKGNFYDFITTANQPEMLPAIKLQKSERNFYSFDDQLDGFESLLYLKILKKGGFFFRDKELVRFYDDEGVDRLCITNPKNYLNMRNGYLKLIKNYGYEFLTHNTKVFFIYLSKLIIYNRLIKNRKFTELDNIIGIITLPLPKNLIKRTIYLFNKIYS